MKISFKINNKNISIVARIIHWLVYWPVFVMYFAFEVAKIIFTKLKYITIPIFIALVILENWLLPKLGIDNLLVLKKLLFKEQWLSYVEGVLDTSVINWLGSIILSLILIVSLLSFYILPALFVSMFISEFSDDFNKRFDWEGIERTFKESFAKLKSKTEDEYISQGKTFIKNKIPKIIINLVSLGILVAIIMLFPIAFKNFSETTGYFQ